MKNAHSEIAHFEIMSRAFGPAGLTDVSARVLDDGIEVLMKWIN